ncbi:hypothetical protein [Pseudomonas sp. DWP1b1]|uniref:hypothetical protein n=1 Tax=unclassified Pseudomonas TaxID=196821 RepID=UPI003CEBE028
MDSTLRIAILADEGKRRIMSSGDWLTAEKLSQLTIQTVDELKANLNILRCEGRIFAVVYEGVEYFPAYALDACGNYRPFLALKAVIDILATRKDAWGMAFWFGSSNSYLGGKQPKEVMQTDLRIVLDAASAEICGIHHG